jgi:small subunit ribosomal protein S3
LELFEDGILTGTPKTAKPAILLEDTKLREYLQARLRNGGLSNVLIERTPKRILLTLNTSRPGVIIGKGGEQIELLREELKKDN